ncbi:MAG: CARDB domain-containing protein, partial [Saprospiraceae bacterium]|nr:CARDB domain-containing protein [Saprospiraceae bacterium]
ISEPPPPDSNTSTLKGTVVDAGTGALLSGVAVTATFEQGNQNLVTGVDGTFTFTGLDGGDGTLSFVKTDYGVRIVSVPLPPNTTLDIGPVALVREQTTQLLPDLIISEVDKSGVVTDHETLHLSGNLQVTATNLGTANATQSFTVLAYFDIDRNGVFNRNFISGDPILGEVVVDGLTLGEVEQLSIPMDGSVTYRGAPISVWIDSKQNVVELNEDNNTYNTAVECKVNGQVAPDLTVSILQALDQPGSGVRVSALVANAGTSNAPASTLTFYEGDPDSGGTQIAQVPTTSLAPGASADFSVDNVTSLQGGIPIYAVIDQNNLIVECDETNNVTTAEAPDLKPDFVISDVDRSGINTDLSSLAVNGTLIATIENIGSRFGDPGHRTL